MDNFYFFSKHHFSLSNVQHSFSKLEMVLTLIITRAKRIEIGGIRFSTHLNAFDSNVFLALKIMNFEDATLTKIIQFYAIKKHECIIYVI